MFVGFIAVIVILLIIVGLMSTGAGSASGGVDQTKVTKIVSEISTLGQAAGFYKSTTADGDYADLNVAALVSNGIVDSNNVEDIANIEEVQDESYGVQDDLSPTVVKSSVVDGVYYDVQSIKDDNSKMYVNVLIDSDVLSDANFLKTLDSTLVSKLSGTSSTANDGSSSAGNTEDTVGDGAVLITFE